MKMEIHTYPLHSSLHNTMTAKVKIETYLHPSFHNTVMVRVKMETRLYPSFHNTSEDEDPWAVI